MCQTTDYYQAQPPRRRRLSLKIKGFFLRLSLSSAVDLPDSLTLLFMPRINGSPLEVNGSKIRPDSPAFLTLHRVHEHLDTAGDVVFAAKDRVRGCDGLSFEVHVGQHRLLRGIFRAGDNNSWRIDCKCSLDSNTHTEMFVGVEDVKEAEISVALDQAQGGSESAEVILREKVPLSYNNNSSSIRRRRRRRSCRQIRFLEEIPEENWEAADYESLGCCCCCCSCDESDGGDEFDVDEDEHMKLMEVERMELEGVKWGVDVGFWLMCFGVAFFVSIATAKRFRRPKLRPL